MARKKTAKTRTKKTTAKSAPMQKNMGSIEKLEKSFREMPSKLAAQYRSELNTLKKQDARLKAEIKKAQQQLKATKKKQSMLTKTKTPTAKKQLVGIKKGSTLLTKTIKMMTGDLNKNKKNMQDMTTKHNTFNALGKQLSILEKQLAKKGKKSTRSTKARKTSSRKNASTSLPKQDANRTPEMPFVSSFNKTETELG